MAIALSILFAVASFAAPVPKPKVLTDDEAILGPWIIADVQIEAVAMANEENVVRRATIDQANVSVNGEKTSYKLNSTKKQIDLTPTGDKPMKGVYEFVGDTLRIAVSLDGAGERPKEAKAGKGNVYFEFHRVKEEKK